MSDPIPDRCTVAAWRPPVDGVAEVFHAHIVDWAYPPHCHDTWTVLIVDDGAIDYALDRKPCAAVGDTVALLPPGVIHDGRPASRARHGFRKRNLCLDADRLPTELTGAAVDRATLVDPDLRRAIARFHDGLVAGIEPLDAEARLALICERIGANLGAEADGREPESTRRVADRLRELLDDRIPDPPTLADAADELGRSVPHLVRSFSAAFGVSPHAYVIGRRIEAARSLLLDGRPPADVAATVGFYDQAHLTRHFKRHTSTTPARYARAGAGAAAVAAATLDHSAGSARSPR